MPNAGANVFFWYDDVGRDTGREKLGGLEGGVESCRRGEVGYHPKASAVSEEAA